MHLEGPLNVTSPAEGPEVISGKEKIYRALANALYHFSFAIPLGLEQPNAYSFQDAVPNPDSSGLNVVGRLTACPMPPFAQL